MKSAARSLWQEKQPTVKLLSRWHIIKGHPKDGSGAAQNENNDNTVSASTLPGTLDIRLTLQIHYRFQFLEDSHPYLFFLKGETWANRDPGTFLTSLLNWW